jgi:Family of unknown function (DUF6056)
MWRKSWQQTLCLLAALSCLGPFVTLAFFARPAQDDYCYTVRLRDLGFIEAQRWYYFHWSGRYAATALLNLSEWTGALEGAYWAYLVATIALTTAAVRLLLSRASRTVGQATDGSFLTSLSVALVVLIMSRISNPVESFYWLPGVFTYQLGVVGVLATTALLLSLSHEPPGLLKVEVATLGILGIVTAGLSEAFPLILLLIYGVFALHAFARGSRSRWIIAGLTLIVAAAGLFSLLSPGNAVRAASEGVGGRQSITAAVRIAGMWSLTMLLRWLPDIGVLAASLAIILLIGDPQRKRVDFLPLFQRRHPIVKVVWLAGLVAAVVFVAVLPNVYALAMTHPPNQHRVINTAYMLFLFVWLVAVVVGANEFLRWRALDRQIVGIMSLVLLLISCVYSENFRESLRELRSLPQFLGEVRARQLAVANVSANDHVVLEPFKAPHRFLFKRDIRSTDVAHWSNTCYAAYLGVASIRLQPLSPVTDKSQRSR